MIDLDLENNKYWTGYIHNVKHYICTYISFSLYEGNHMFQTVNFEFGGSRNFLVECSIDDKYFIDSEKLILLNLAWSKLKS